MTPLDISSLDLHSSDNQTYLVRHKVNIIELKWEGFVDSLKSHAIQGSLVVPNMTLTLDDCMSLHLKAERVDQVYCGQCKTHQHGNKQLFIWKTPEYLIIHLKRFSMNQKGHWTKRYNHIK